MLNPLRLLSISFIFLGSFFGSCDEFFTRSVMLGGNLPQTDGGGNGTDNGDGGDGSTAPADDDADGLSNEVESSFAGLSGSADSDHDGFSDGLEFVGRLGDPLNSRLSPSSFNRQRILPADQVINTETDGDGDGLGDFIEQDFSTDPDRPDSDEDGYSDGLEVVAGSDALSATSRPQRSSAPSSDGTPSGTVPLDSDGDGMADALENLNGGSITNRDTDGDGYSDGIEFLMGSDAIDPASVPNFSTQTSS